MRVQRERYSLEAGEEKGREPPQWFIDQPHILPGEEFYVNAFFRLDTDRSLGMAEGPIPWSKRVDYGERAGLDGDMVNVFADIIGVVDNVYLEKREEKARQERARETKGPRQTKG